MFSKFSIAALLGIALFFSYNAFSPQKAEALDMTGTTCVGGQLVGVYNDYQDAVDWQPNTYNFDSICYAATPPGGCCSVEVMLNNDFETSSYPWGVRLTARGYLGGSAIDNPSSCRANGLNVTYECFAGVLPPDTSTAITASLVANPTSIVRGQSSLLSWASTGATACTGTGFSTGGATSGSVLVSPTATTQYTVTCTQGAQSASDSETVTVTTTACSNTCSGQSLVNSCSGAVVEACSTQCSSQCGTDPKNPPPQQCTPGLVCVGADLYSQDAACNQQFVQACSFGCSQGSCYMGPGNGANSDPQAYIVPQPGFIRKGLSCNLLYSAKNVGSCTITGPGLNVTELAVNGAIATSTVSTGPLQSTQSYKMTCIGLNDTILEKDTRCSILPTFREI